MKNKPNFFFNNKRFPKTGGVRHLGIFPTNSRFFLTTNFLPHAGHTINDMLVKDGLNLLGEELDCRLPLGPPPGIQPQGPRHVCPSCKMRQDNAASSNNRIFQYLRLLCAIILYLLRQDAVQRDSHLPPQS